MKKIVCPGSFDPVTNGHLDVFIRAANMFDELVVAVFHNPNKEKSMFSMEERVELLRECTKDYPNIRVDSFSGLLYDYMEKENCNIILRGLRAMLDFEYEFQRALMLKKINPNIETVFMVTKLEYSYLSSTGVREILAFNGSVAGLVPECVEERINKKNKR